MSLDDGLFRIDFFTSTLLSFSKTLNPVKALNYEKDHILGSNYDKTLSRFQWASGL